MVLPPFPPGPILTSIGDFVEQPLEEEEFHRVAGARVVFARYDLLRHDFAFDGWSDGEIDHWLVAHCAIVSKPQAAQTETNAPIAIGHEMRRGYRAPLYGRAAILPVDGQQRLIDVKGIGVRPGRTPKRKLHYTGILDATNALQEVLFEWLIAVVLHRAGSAAAVVPAYALLDLGFDAIGDDGARQPAFALARRAHTRPRIMWGDDPLDAAELATVVDLVLLLRSYGILRNDGPFEIFRRDADVVLEAFGREHLFRGAEAERVAALFRCNAQRMRLHVGSMQYDSGMRQRPPAPRLLDFGGFVAAWDDPVPIYIPASYNVYLAGEVIHPGDARYPVTGPGRVSVLANALPRFLAAAYARGARDGQ